VSVSEYFSLGNYSRSVSTSSPQAKTWVERGLAWSYAFHHEEAVACFQRAIAADPDCALAHWGIAYALGPNYNKPWEAFQPGEAQTAVARAHAAVTQAERCAGLATGPEQALIAALGYRYPDDRPSGDNARWNRDYAGAMRAAYRDYPDDLDVAVLFADALMNLTPWQLWDTATGKPADGAATIEIRDVLDRILTSPAGRAHIGALHLYIHLMEMSQTPEDALWAGELLRDLAPDAGHLVHMPTHLDVLCGDYRQAVAGNDAAIKADARVSEQHGATTFYMLYRAHNYHFKIYGAMFLGQSHTALETADALARLLPDSLLRTEIPPMADWLEGFVSIRVHALIRFGRWQQLIDNPLPSDQELYCVTTAMLAYGKGIAYATTGDIDAARETQRQFTAAVSRVPVTRTIFNNTCQDILQVAAAMLAGELDYREGHYETAFAHLRRAVDLDDDLPYDEPWAWMQPARHALGALLLEQGHVEEAGKVYRADLGLDGSLPRPCQHPGNVWSLHGYHEVLSRLGRSDEAAIIGQQLRIALARADVPIGASCFCRTGATRT